MPKRKLRRRRLRRVDHQIYSTLKKSRGFSPYIRLPETLEIQAINHEPGPMKKMILDEFWCPKGGYLWLSNQGSEGDESTGEEILATKRDSDMPRFYPQGCQETIGDEHLGLISLPCIDTLPVLTSKSRDCSECTKYLYTTDVKPSQNLEFLILNGEFWLWTMRNSIQGQGLAVEKVSDKFSSQEYRLYHEMTKLDWRCSKPHLF